MNETNNPSLRIESKIDKGETASIQLGTGGNLNYGNLNQIMEVAKVVAISQAAIPKHLRDNVGACLAICIQSSEWGLSPFAVANKSYVVNDRLSFEAQLVAAVIMKRAPIKGRIKYEWSGEGAKRKCRAFATLLDGDLVDYESPEIGTIPTKNSPLWKADPDQQLGYYSVRAMCRRHFPDVLLGIYTPEEMAEAIDITAETRTIPEAKIGKIANRPEKKPAESVFEEAMRVEAEAHAHIPKDEEPPTNAASGLQPPADDGIDTSTQEAPVPPPASTGPSAATLLAVLVKKAKAKHNMSKSVLTARLLDAGILKDTYSLDDLDAKQLANIIDGLDEMGGGK